MSESFWYLKRVTLTNILGFKELKEFTFSEGVQVIEADNHTGKTSLAIALVWGLTGQLPKIDRITANQFKLKHKLAGDKEEAAIEIILESNDGHILAIHRKSKSSASKNDLSITFDGEEFEETRAQKMIDKYLGLSPTSLEGCCVVLQEQRLSLITGDLAKSSQTIHGILGLSTLSKLVPIIKDKLAAISKLIRSYDNIDPLKIWTEKHDMLKGELEKRELEAAQNGCDRREFMTSDFLIKAFTKLVQELNLNFDCSVMQPKMFVSSIRDALEKKREQNPFISHVTLSTQKLNAQRETKRRLINAYERLTNKYSGYQDLQARSGISAQAVDGILKTMEEKRGSQVKTLNTLREQNGLLTHSLALLLEHTDAACCPLCEQSINRQALLENIQNKMSDSLQFAIKNAEVQVKESEESLKGVFELQNNYRVLKSEVVGILEEIALFLEEQHRATTEGDVLAKLPAILKMLEDLKAVTDKGCIDLEQEVVSAQEKSMAYNASIKPVGDTLDRISHYYIPVYEVQRALLDHENHRGATEKQNQEFQAIIQQAKKYENDLTQFKNYLQIQEKEKANKVVEEHGEFVSRFYSRVADNPNYDKIFIKAKEDRGSIKYDFEAMSSRSPHFNDAAKHVLSGGDLSCACLGLILSLTRGKSNKSGFLVLDDPGESLDHVRLENLVKEIQSEKDRQTIILTHQKEFAELLRKSGAKSFNI